MIVSVKISFRLHLKTRRKTRLSCKNIINYMNYKGITILTILRSKPVTPIHFFRQRLEKQIRDLSFERDIWNSTSYSLGLKLIEGILILNGDKRLLT